MTNKRAVVSVLLTLLLGATFAQQARAQWSISTADGRSSLKLGVLAQGQAEWVESDATEDTRQNLFLRRLRVFFVGQLDPKLSFFVDVDSPNLGKSDDTGKKKEVDVFVQDAFVTYSFSPALQIDAGMMLFPVTYNAAIGAGRLLALDYGPYTTAISAPLDLKTLRDYGVQVRGYPAGQHLEYRVAVFQGRRDPEGNAPFRFSGRLAWQPFEPQTGFFYVGTAHAEKKLLVLGAAYDGQDDYHSYGADVFTELPLGAGAVTFQAAASRIDGGTFLTTLPDQKTYLVETGWFVRPWKLTPYVQAAWRDLQDEAAADQRTLQFGLAFWPQSHRFNLKAAATRTRTDEAPDTNQYVIQLQLFAL